MEIFKKILKIMGVFILLCTSIFTIDLSSKQSVSAAGSDDFVYTIKGESTKIPVLGKGYTVTYTDTLGTHTIQGEYGNTVTFTGSGVNDEHDIRVSGLYSALDTRVGTSNIIDIKQWGTTKWSSLISAFYGQNFERYSATDSPDLSQGPSLKSMFSKSTFNGNINNWNVSQVKDMSQLFQDNVQFNQPLNNWDVSATTSMRLMFNNAIAFNQTLDTWHVNNVKDMAGMFLGATVFNQPLNTWVVNQVVDMSSMFENAESFNQPLNNWHVDNVQNMRAMFKLARVFNQPLENWNTGHVQNMDLMFSGTHAFNQPVNQWNVEQVKTMSEMFSGAWLFNQPLNQWNVGQVVNMDSMFSGARAFNQPLDQWNVLSVQNMHAMFANTWLFNQPLSNWNVENVQTMKEMFQSASVFNQPLNQWNVTKVSDMGNMFSGAIAFDQALTWDVTNTLKMEGMLDHTNISLENYNKTLNHWSTFPASGPRTLGAQGLYYSVINERNILINTLQWKILGDTFAQGKIQVVKQDKETGEQLAGAEFDIKTLTGTVVDHVISDNMGYALSKDLPLGDYKVIETKEPLGYLLDTNELQVKIPKAGEIVLVQKDNIKAHAKIEITKQDDKTQVKLAGAEFDITNKNGTVVDHVITDENGLALTKDLPLGEYTLVETTAPFGYESNNVTNLVNLTVNGQIFKQIINNTQSVGKIEIEKQDKTSLVKLMGAEYDVKDQNGLVIDHIITDANGIAQTKDLRIGIYTLIETQAPTGYMLDITPKVVKIETHNQVVKTVLFNKKQGHVRIILNKVDKANRNIKLAGAEYEIKDTAGNLVERLVTGADGVATTLLDEGVYTVNESKAPFGYVLELATAKMSINPPVAGKYDSTVSVRGGLKNIFFISTAKENTIEISYTNAKKPDVVGKIQIVKQDKDTHERLGEAEFDIIDKSGNKVDHIVTGIDGTVTTKEYPFGDYSIIETKAPQGYDINPDPIDVKIDTANQVIQKNIDNTKTAPKVGHIEIIKQDKQTQFKLVNAEFIIKDATGNKVDYVVTDVNGKAITKNLPLGDYTLEEVKAPQGYDRETSIFPIKLDSNNKVVTQTVDNTKSIAYIEVIKQDQLTSEKLQGAEFDVKDTTGNTVANLVTDSLGKAKTNALPLGIYTLIEKKSPQNYGLNSTPVQVRLATENQVVTQVINNSKMLGKIEVAMNDRITGKVLSGAEFDVQDTNGKTVDHIVTDVTGKALTNNLPLGDYTLKETKSSAGYEMDEVLLSTKISTTGEVAKVRASNTMTTGKIEIIKQDVLNGARKLAGAEFDVKDASGKFITKIITDVNGLAITDNVQKGSYTVTEIKAPVGYELNTNPITFEVELHNQIVTKVITNTQSVGKIEITKVDKTTGAKLVGAEFAVVDTTNNQVDYVTTDATGKAVTKDLPVGEYKLIEKKAPAGYELDATPVDAKIKAHNDYVQVSKDNVQSVGKIEITKVDKTTGAKLVGAEFAVLDTTNNQVDYVTTDATGKAVTKDLPVGEYKLIEKKAPAGYELDATPVDAKIKAHNDYVQVSKDNVQSVGKIEITKIDKATGAKLVGAEFSVLDTANNQVDYVTTDVTGKAVTKDLLVGEYKLIEKKAPAGYELDATPVDAKIKAHNDYVQVSKDNVQSVGKIEITKVDKTTGAKLVGAEFAVVDTTNNQVDYVTTDATGKAVTKDLPVGEYKLIEKKAPVGYQLDATPITVELTTNGQVVTKTIANTKTPVVPQVGQIEITKVDKSDGTKLSGAEFDVEDTNGVVAHLVTDGSGKVKTSNLPLGTYTLVETKAPAGYELDATPVTVTLTTNGQVVTKTIANTKTPVVPQVGQIEITKVDKSDGTKLAGAEFDVKDTNGVVAHLVTDGSGKVKTSNLPLGTYTLVETKAPVGYQLDATPVTVTLTTNGQVVTKTIANTKTPVNPKIGQIKIIKQDKITLDRLKGAEFDIKDASGKVVMHVVTGTDGAIQTDALPFGKYTIVETKAPKGYQIDPEIMSVVIDINHLLVVRVSVGLKESQPVGIIGITKKDKKNGLNLAGAEFDIKDADGKIVDHVITDVQGYGVTKSLPLGLYTIIEVKAPAGYKLDKTVNSVVINDADEHVKITINNEKLSGPITPEKPKPVTDVKVPKMEEKLPDTGNGENCDNGICILSFMFVILLSISARFYSNNKSI